MVAENKAERESCREETFTVPINLFILYIKKTNGPNLSLGHYGQDTVIKETTVPTTCIVPTSERGVEFRDHISHWWIPSGWNMSLKTGGQD